MRIKRSIVQIEHSRNIALGYRHEIIHFLRRQIINSLHTISLLWHCHLFIGLSNDSSNLHKAMLVHGAKD